MSIKPETSSAPTSVNGSALWYPDVTVATVVARDGRLLMVEEEVHGALVINQPAGHLEPDESLIQAAIRETREETGWDVAINHFIGTYQWTAPGNGDGRPGRHFIRIAFAATPVRHYPDQSLDEGIVRAFWLSPTELQNAAAQHRSPLVWRVAADYLAGRRLPLDCLTHLA